MREVTKIKNYHFFLGNLAFWIVVFFYSGSHSNLIGLVALIFISIAVIGTTFLGQIVVYLIINKRSLSTAFKAFFFSIPTIIMAISLLFLMIVDQKPNQKTHSYSFDRQYFLTVSEKENFWTFRIYEHHNQLKYEDDSTFSGYFKVYWIWDYHNRLWLYNSDDQCVYFLEHIDGQWQRYKWGYKREKETSRLLYPPDSVYPPYVTSNSQNE
ncbi:hypothetical protein WDW89_20930 [Deltaproteobacteria bacterium TL4]